MKTRLLSAAVALVAFAFPAGALAATTGNVEATMTVTYSCDITHPAVSTLTPSGSTATAASANFAYEQNGATAYDLSALTITGPANGMTGTIAFNAGATEVVANSSTSLPNINGLPGVISETDGNVDFTLNTTDPAFTPGAYSISSTLSCAEEV